MIINGLRFARFRSCLDASQIVDYQNLEVLKMEYDSILNNLNLETVVKDEALLKALQAIMEFPSSKWRVFLHPIQRTLARRNYNGAAQVIGGAGTGGVPRCGVKKVRDRACIFRCAFYCNGSVSFSI